VLALLNLNIFATSGETTLRRQLQPTRKDEEQLLRRYRRQPLHPGLRVLGQLIQGLLGRIGQDCTGSLSFQPKLNLTFFNY
jgi:hypothetical protein